MTAGALPHHAS